MTTVEIASEPKQWSCPGVMSKIGVVLFLLSFLTPPHWGDGFFVGGGFVAFIETPVWALIGATQGVQERDWHLCLLAVLMIIGWSANFTIFLRQPLPIALMFITSPWILYIGWTLLGNTVGTDTTAITFIPFYPWAFGIALIHLARLVEPRPKAELRCRQA